MALNANSRIRPLSAGKKRSSAKLRQRIILPIVRLRIRQAASERVAFLTPRGDELRTPTELVEYQSRLAGISPRSVWRWYHKFVSAGYVGLTRKKRCDAEKSRSLGHRGLALFFISEKKEAGWSALATFRALASIWSGLYPNTAAPCYSSVRRHFAKVRL